MDVFFIQQLVESMESVVRNLESAKEKGDKDSFNKAKVFLFDLHRKLNEALSGD